MINSKNSKFFLVGILLAALFLRLWKLSEVPVALFGDEVDVGYHAFSLFKTGNDYNGNFLPIHFRSIAEWRTPLYLYSAVPTVAIFGITPLGVRLPAVIFGVMGIFAFYLLVRELLKIGKLSEQKINQKNHLALLAAGILAISPWHLQYSRAGFEVTMLLAFLTFGMYFFFKSVNEKGKYLWLSLILIGFTPWIYSTAKLFTPLLLIFLFVVFNKQILSFSKKTLGLGAISILLVGAPILYSTVFGGGWERAGFTSVFTDDSVINKVGVNRGRDVSVRGAGILFEPNLTDRIFHNKFKEWYETISGNFLKSFSFDFLFNEGDPNLRHSIEGMGLFYKVEFLALVFGLIFYFTSNYNFKIKLFVAFWIFIGALPSALTRDGGTHATRLILILPPLIFLISYGILDAYRKIDSKLKYGVAGLYFFALSLSFIFYFHSYYTHYPWDSERWWHAGWSESLRAIRDNEGNYNKVIISMRGEPAWIFFAGLNEYPPEKWQREYPIGNDIHIRGFGKISHIDKYYFGSFNEPGKGIYDLGKYLDSETLYLATANEVNVNLIQEPLRTPSDLNLISSIPYPSGEPAYYLFSGR